VLFEEKGGNPETVSIATQSAHVLCSHISEFHPLDFRSFVQENSAVSDKAILRLECTTGQQIATITFASFGNPYGECGNFLKGSCHADTSYNILNKVGMFKHRQTEELSANNELFCPLLLRQGVKSMQRSVNHHQGDKDNWSPRKPHFNFASLQMFLTLSHVYIELIFYGSIKQVHSSLSMK
jgi:hypothetical protein